MRFRQWAPAGLVCAAVAWAADRPAFTIDQVMSAPFASGLTAAPKGSRIAWVFNRSGVRNIWAAEGPDYKGREVTGYAADDGIEISGLAWTPDAAWIVFVRGSDRGREGNYPNPLSRPEGGDQAVWIVPVRGGRPRRLDEGSAPAVSPKGDRVAYVKKDQIWSVRLSGEPKPVPLIKARGNCGSLRWSPDGAALAFVSARDDHSFVGVYDIAGQPLSLTVRGRGRQDIRGRTLSARTPMSERNDRLYELALRYEPASDGVAFEVQLLQEYLAQRLPSHRLQFSDFLPGAGGFPLDEASDQFTLQDDQG